MSTPLNHSLPPAVLAYDKRAAEYDAWYEKNQDLYRAELDLVASFIEPLRDAGPGLEIGAGTGRFAAPLGIDTGLEPSRHMGDLARGRGIHIVAGLAEDLPFADQQFGYTAFLTSLCFVTDRAQAITEARRVTRPGGGIVIAFLNPLSDLGRELDATKAADPLYADASFITPEELAGLLNQAGYNIEEWAQLTPDSAGGAVTSSGADDGLYCVVWGRLS